MSDHRIALAELAQAQGGYFTAAQAEDCGFWRQNHARYVASGEWIRVMRGIYRLALLPEPNFGEYHALSLFFRHRDGRYSGVFALESAMFVRGIGDFLPNKIKVAVQPGFRKWAQIPSMVELVSLEFLPEDVEENQGFPLMKCLPTIVQLLLCESSERHLVKEAFFQCRKKGFISRSSVRQFLMQAFSQGSPQGAMIAEWEREFSPE